MLKLSDSDVILSIAMKDMLKKWDKTASAWRDQARAEFEKDYINELRPAAKAAFNAMKRISGFLTQVRRECS